MDDMKTVLQECMNELRPLLTSLEHSYSNLANNCNAFMAQENRLKFNPNWLLLRLSTLLDGSDPEHKLSKDQVQKLIGKLDILRQLMVEFLELPD